MRKAESSLATPLASAIAIVRACLVFFGTTVAAHSLAAGTTDGRFRPLDQQDFTTQITGAGLPSYLSWLGDAFAMDQAVLRALANTLWLGVMASMFAVAFGMTLSWLLRVRGLGRLVGGALGPLLALSVPGVLLFPIYRWADSQQLLPDGPTTTDQAASSVAFLAFWGAVVGLALAPGLASQFIGAQHHRSAGAETAAITTTSLPVRIGARAFGFPTAVFLLGLASAELASGHNGLFRHMVDQLTAGELAGVLDVTLVIALVGAVVVLTADVLRITTGREADDVGPDRPTRLTDKTWPLLAALAVLVVVAAVGYLREPLLSAGQNQPFQTPAFGGPWLGTDGAGASFVERLVIALGPTMTAALIPGLGAAIVGGVIHQFARRVPALIDRVIVTVVDVAWWPLPVLLPLAHLNAGNPERSEVDLTVTLVTVAALTPLAVRALRRATIRGQAGIRPLLSVAVVLVALAGSARIFLGFLGVTNGPHGPTNADLGAMVASGVATSGLGAVWAVTPPMLAGLVLLSLLYWLAGAISTPVPHRELAPATAEPLLADATRPAEPTDRVGPLGPQDLRSVVRQQADSVESTAGQDITIGQAPDDPPSDDPDDPDDLGFGDDLELAEDDNGPDRTEEVIDLGARPAEASPVQRRPVVNLAERLAADPAEAESNRDNTPLAERPATVGPIDENAVETTPDHSAGSNQQAGGQQESDQQASVEADHEQSGDGQLDDDIDEQTKAELDLLNATSADLAADASKTIELRPSTLRRAGIVAPGTKLPPNRTNTRPILAAKAEQYDEDDPTERPADPVPPQAEPPDENPPPPSPPPPQGSS